MAATHEITAAHFRFYVRDLHTSESVGFFKSLAEAVKAYPAASLNVPERIKTACGFAAPVEITTLEDLQATDEANVEYCHETETSIEDIHK